MMKPVVDTGRAGLWPTSARVGMTGSADLSTKLAVCARLRSGGDLVLNFVNIGTSTFKVDQ